MNDFYLSELATVDPPHECPHEQSEAFLIEIHEASQKISGGQLPVDKLISRYGVSARQIAARRVECDDYKIRAEDRKLYNLSGSPEGASIELRTKFFAERARVIVDEFYPQSASAPEHLIHVTCTGYAAPSAIQRLVADRQWAATCTNAYHMGCFAALPAIRMGIGQVSAFGGSADVVHTEMCTLHLNPSLHTPEQIVVQTLFGDGHAKYRLSQEVKGPAFKILALAEKVLPGTANLMSWSPAPSGMAMTLSREVPARIDGELRAFVENLTAKAGLSLDTILREGIFAVHPGGPKIIDAVAHTLELTEGQIGASREILRNRGNMSSATLPHIWKRLLESDLKRHSHVVSLAFGPGLSLFGSVFEVHS